jgi:hypothetical protein
MDLGPLLSLLLNSLLLRSLISRQINSKKKIIPEDLVGEVGIIVLLREYLE